MVFGVREISSLVMNTISSTPPKKKRMHRLSQSLDDFSRVVGSDGNPRRTLVSRSRRKHLIPNARKQRKSPEEDFDLEKQFGKGRFIDDSECMWLSSDCLSPSSFFDQYRFLGSRHFVDDWLVSWLSRVAWVSSIESADLDLDTSLKGDSEDGEAASWLLIPFENEASFSALCLTEDTTSSDNSSSQLGQSTDSQTQVLDGANFMFSSADLDLEDCKLISNNVESDRLENFRLDGTSNPYLQGSSSSSSHHVSELMAEQLYFSSEEVSAADMKSDGEPIFWPFEAKFDSNAEETMRYLSMSPRKDIKVGGVPKLAITRILGQKGGPRRQLQFESSGSESYERSELSQSAGKTLGKVNAAAPSRLGRNPENSTKVVPLASEESMSASKKTWSSEERDFLLEEDLSSKIDYELPIEKILGLQEFDGREGVEAEFDGRFFLLDESLQQFVAQ